MSKIGFVAILGSTLWLSACVTRGQNFSSDTRWLDQSKPTRTQVRTLMGPPYKVGSSNGIPTWTYGYYKHQLFGDSHVKELKIYWSNDAIKTYSFSSSFPQDVAKAGR